MAVEYDKQQSNESSTRWLIWKKITSYHRFPFFVFVHVKK